MGITRSGAGSRMPRKMLVRLAAIVAALTLLTTGSIVGASSPAYADDYPTWDEVVAVRNDVAAKQALVEQIRAQLAGLQAEVARTQAEVEVKGNAYQEADNRFQAKSAETAALQEQADAALAVADASAVRAGQMAAKLMRGGAEDITANLFVSADPENLLDSLGMSSKLSEQSYLIYEQAAQDKNTAQALSDTAEVAKAQLEVLKLEAERLFQEAQVAAQAAAAALQAQLEHQAILERQLVVLQENLAVTEADYRTGVVERLKADVNFDAGYISDAGWVRPAGGYISSTFGWRVLYGADNFHKGLDLAAGCGANIYAATAGTVVYAAEGWNGGYGNYIIVDHGGGISTAYGHIMPGGILVSPGQNVGIGQNIARVGTTGNSTGCHLHFETRVGGVAQDPIPFMAARGINFG